MCADAAATGAHGLNCNACPNAVVEVCAEMANGLSVTVSHPCFAICQGLVNIRRGNCEDTFNAALSEHEEYTLEACYQLYIVLA
jgi:hypothetical protein